MWELCDCIELTLILATGIKVDRTQYRHTHTHKSRITKNSWNSFSSHLSLHFGFFLAQKKRPNNGHAEKSIECRAIENSFVVGQLFMIMPTCSIDRIDPYFSLWCRPFPVFLSFYSRDVP